MVLLSDIPSAASLTVCRQIICQWCQRLTNLSHIGFIDVGLLDEQSNTEGTGCNTWLVLASVAIMHARTDDSSEQRTLYMNTRTANKGRHEWMEGPVGS